MEQYTDTSVNQLVINKMTKEQYNNLQNPSDTELYLIPDEIDTTPTSNSTNPVTSGGVYTALGEKPDKVMYVDASTPPASMDPNKVYQFGTLSGDTTFPAFSAVAPGDTEVKVWCWTFTTPSTAPTITWPAGITGWNGGTAPVIVEGTNYEVSVMDGIACIIE